MNTETNTETTDMTNTETETTDTKKRASKNSTEAYGAKGKTNLLTFDPRDLVIVDDPTNPLHDERVNLPVSDAMVKNLLAVGQIRPISVRKNPETGKTEVVVGRQMVKTMIAANKILEERGEEQMLITAVITRGKDNGTLAGIVASENAIRQAETPLMIAKKMERILSHGKTEEELPIYFGMTKQTVKNYLSLLECTAAVRNAIEAGKIGISHALALSKLPPEKQREAVENMIKAADGEKGGKHQKAKKAREAAEAAGVQVVRVRGKKEIAEFRAKVEERCNPEFRDFVLNVLDWVSDGGREPRIPHGNKATKVA